MTEPIILFYNEYIVPYVRMTQRSKYTDRAQRYLASQVALAYSLKSSMAINEFDMIPGQTPFSVEIICSHTAGYRADIDNIEKAVMDAAKGILYPDDRWCDDAHIVRQGRKTNGMRIVVMEMERRHG